MQRPNIPTEFKMQWKEYFEHMNSCGTFQAKESENQMTMQKKRLSCDV